MDLAGSGAHAFGRDEIQATELVVVTEIAPVGAFRPVLPSL